MDPTTDSPPPTLALPSLALAMLLPSMATSIANIALPTLEKAFAAPFQQIQWVVLSFLLGITVTIVGAGRLGDLLGRRRLLLGGTALFTAASALCALAPGLPALIGARALQGVGAAIMMALAMAMVGESAPRQRTGAAMGLLATMSAVGTALGPSLGGWLIGLAGWPAVFWISVPLGLLALVAAALSLPKQAKGAPAAARFDLAGTVALGLAIAAFALAMTVGRGRFGALNALMMCAAIASGAGFLHIEGRAAAPLLQPGLLHRRPFGAGFLANALVAAVVMATLVVGPFYLSGALMLDPSRVGMTMAAGPLVAAIVGLPAGHLVDRFGPVRIVRAGIAAMAAGALAFSLLPLSMGTWGFILPLVSITAGYGLFQSANNTMVMASAMVAERGVVSGVLSLSRYLGLIAGAALMGAVFAFGSGPAPTPASLSNGLHLAYAVATLLLLAALWISRQQAAATATSS